MVSAITGRYDCIKNVIVTDGVKVQNALGEGIIMTNGQWDTGATNSCITKKAAEKLGLPCLSKTKVRNVHGISEVNVYAIKIYLSNDNISVPCIVTECSELSDDGNVDLLLGMNIISKGDFVISNYGRKTVMTFRVPSLQTTDFVEEINDFNRILKIHDAQSKKGIEKCPCESGKLFKNCHGNSIYFGK